MHTTMFPVGCVKSCPSCKHREFTREESLAQKFRFLSSKLAGWVDVLEPVRSVADEQRWGYRSKTVMSARWNGNHWQFGMMANDTLIPIPDCPVHAPVVNSTLRILSTKLPDGNTFPLVYVVQTGAQVVLIVKSKNLVETSWLTNEVKNQLEQVGVEGLWLHLNPSAGRRLFEKTPFYLLFGQEKSQDSDGFFYGPGAFQQLIPALYNQSLDIAVDFFKPSNKTSIVDLYCGIGKSMYRWTNANADVIGVELGKDAVECAKFNVPRARVLRGACRQRVPQIREWVNRRKYENKSIQLYVNPPRTGVEQEVLEWIVTDGKPNRIAYLSCSAGTLSKNLRFFTQNGYSVTRLVPFDFFPQTIHVECLALIEKVKSTSST